MAPEERDQHEETRKETAPGAEPPAGDAPEELRYEGPITIDDEDDDEYFDEGGGSGKVFLTAAVLSALVLVIIATAMWMRSGKRAETSDFAAMEPPPVATETAEQAAAPGTAGEVDYRALPDTPAGKTATAGTTAPALPPVEEPAPARRAEATAPAPPAEAPAIERPAPRAARDVQQAAPSPREPAAAPTLADVRRQVLAGHVAAAARAGEAWARTRPAREWTLQVLLACQPDTVRRAFRKVVDPDLVVLPARLRGRACYRVCWRTFASERAAKEAVGEVPAHFRRDAKPIARTWGEILP